MEAQNQILLDDKVGGKGKFFTTRFLQAGLVKYSFGVCLLDKETIDRFIYNFVGCPVIINHKDVTSDSAKNDRVGVISRVWFNEQDGWYWGEGVIFEQEALDLIDKGYNVSCQYEITEYSSTGGIHNGNEYDKTILNGKPEHLAIVKNPRYENAMIAVNAMEIEEMNLEAINEDKWITIHPHGEEGKGRPLLLKDGETPKEAIERTYGKKGDSKSSKGDKGKEGKKEKAKESSAEDKKYKDINSATKVLERVLKSPFIMKKDMEELEKIFDYKITADDIYDAVYETGGDDDDWIPGYVATELSDRIEQAKVMDKTEVERKTKKENKEQSKKEVKKENLTEKEINDRLKEQSQAVSFVVKEEMEKLGLWINSSIGKNDYGDAIWGDQVYERFFHREYNDFSDEKLESLINKAIKNTKKETGVSIKLDKIGDRKYRFEAISKGDVKKFLSNEKKKVNEKAKKEANSFHNTLKDIKKKGFNYLARDDWGYIHAYKERPRYTRTIDDGDDYEPGYWSNGGEVYGKSIGTEIKESEANAYLKLYDKYQSGGSTSIWTIDDLLNAKKKKAKNDIIMAINEIKGLDMFKNLFRKKEKNMDREEIKEIMMECLTELTASNEADKKDEPDYKKMYEDLKAECEAKAKNEEKEEDIEEEKEEVVENKCDKAKAKNEIEAQKEAMMSEVITTKSTYITQSKARELGKELF